MVQKFISLYPYVFYDFHNFRHVSFIRKYKDENWKVKKIMDFPYLHRFDLIIQKDGKILFAFNPTEEIIKSIEETNVKTEKSPYIDAQIKEVKNDKAHKEIRIYKNRTNIYPLKFTKTDFVYGLCTAIAVGTVSYLQFSNIF